MIHKNMLAFLGVLVCVHVGVQSAEPPISPWQSLNPTREEPIQYEASIPEIHEIYEMPAAEYDDSQYEITYSEEHQLNETDYLSEEELLVEKLPFKLPFKMDKKQLAVAIKIMKEAVFKPILRSKEVRAAVAYIDDSLSSYKSDVETQMYVTLLLDSLQEIAEGKETSELNMIIKRLFTDMSDEETARTLDTVWRSYLSPFMTSLIYNPVRNYVVTPVRDYIYDPLSNYVIDFADRIGTWMESSSRPYIDIQYPETYSRWSDTVNAYTNHISDFTAKARQGLEMASRMLELQEEARCYDCGGGASQELDEQYSSVQVKDLSWLPWLIGGVGLAVLIGAIAAIAIAPAIAIPLALAGGPTGPTGPVVFGPPPGNFAQPPVAGNFAQPPVAGNFAQPPQGGPFAPPPGAGQIGGGPGGFGGQQPFTNRRDYSPYAHIKRKAEAFDDSILEESNFNVKFGDEDTYTQYSKYEEK